jgi:hypothetical protein
MMAELIEILTTKLGNADKLYSSLTEIEKDIQKLDAEGRKSLPKFRGGLDEKSLSRYLEEATQAVKNPIRFKRKTALIELGIASIENVKDEVFDDDNIEKTIQILGELKSYERLFRVLSQKISSSLVQHTISNVNVQLENTKKNIESLKKIEEIRSEGVKDYCLRKYINGELEIYQIDEIKGKVAEIEETLNLSIKEKEISLIDEVYKLIIGVKEYGKKFEKHCLDLNNAKESLEKFEGELKQEYEQVKLKILFWQKSYPEVYVQETKNIDILTNKLRELEEKCKKKYKSFNILKQIYDKKLYEDIDNLIEFASKLDKVISYLPNLEVTNKEDLDTVKEIYNQISWLEEIEYPNVKELFREATVENVKELLKTVTQIREEYECLKENLKVYQRILGVQEEQIDKYPLLKQKIEKYRYELQNKIGEGFESLIRFLKEETENIEVDEETLKNFIKTVKPFLKEALGI